MMMDFHSGALTKAQWKPFIPFIKWASRTAPFTICHNRTDGREIESWGGRAVHLLTLPQEGFSGHLRMLRGGRPLFLFSCSFAEDEPVEVALEAMRQCPEFDFVISGNYRKRGLDPTTQPANIRLAGFMDYQVYLQTMAEAHAVITLSDRPHIMQMAVHEAITLGTPVITNKSPALEEVLQESAVYCDLTTPSLSAGFREIVRDFAGKSEAILRAKARAFANISAETHRARNANPEIFQAA